MIEFCEKDTKIILNALDCLREKIEENKDININLKDVEKLINRIEVNNIDRHIRNMWRAMLDRCRNPNNIAYKIYGARGISVYEEWLHLKNFKKWCIDNNYQIGLSIDRIDVNGNYEPSNCRFATQKEQQRNRRNNRILIDPFDNEKLCVAAMAEKYNMTISCLSDRINTRKMPLKEALEKSIRKVSNITDENNNKISISDKIILWHDNVLIEGEEYTTKRIANEINVNFHSLLSAIAPTHNKSIADFLLSEFQYRKYKNGNLYIKNSNWIKDVSTIGTIL